MDSHTPTSEDMWCGVGVHHIHSHTCKLMHIYMYTHIVVVRLWERA